MLKRVLLCLTLALTLCLSLCACDSELPPEKLEPLYGTWIVDTAFDGEHKALESSAFLLTFTEDGQFFFDDQGGMTWTAREDRETSYLEVTIRAEKKVVYKFTMALGDEGTQYNGWLTDKKDENFFGSYQHLSAGLDVAWADKTYIEWYPEESEENTATLKLNKDGTCTIDGKTYQWIKHPFWEVDEDRFVLFVFDDTHGVCTIHAQLRDTGVPILYVDSYETNMRHTYQFHPLLNTFTGWRSWQSFDKNNAVSDDVYISSDEMSLNNESVKWELSESTTNDQLVICVPSAAAPEYVLTMTMEGEYPNLALEVKATGEIINYYQYDAGYDPANPEAIYYDAVRAINCYLNDNSYWNDTLESSLYDEKILPYAYARFLEVADYKESQSYLDRFTIYENKLVSVTRAYADKLGNSGESTNYSRYYYDIEGRLCQVDDSSLIETYGVYDLQYYDGYLTYDANNVVTDLTLKSGSSVYAKCTPTYDEAGNLISMHVQTNSNEYTSTFTYNEQGQLVQLEIPYSSYSYIYTYAYDEAGLLTQKTYAYGRNYNTVTDYTYENGLLVQETRNVTEYRDSWVTTYTYTYDADGNVLTKSVSTNDPDYTLTKEEYLYIYEDVYFYSAD